MGDKKRPKRLKLFDWKMCCFFITSSSQGKSIHFTFMEDSMTLTGLGYFSVKYTCVIN